MDLIKNIFPTQTDNEFIQYIKKKEYETYYSTKNKWPYLVIERLTMQTGLPAHGNAKINREDINDPFGPDKNIKPEHSFTADDYAIMMSYGLSPGHNAPAGHHYTSLEIWNETFSYANISPQEMTFNSGIWVILENWCKYISKQQKQKNFTNLRVFTGSIPDKTNSILKMGEKTVYVNIPTHMFKLVCARSKNENDKNKLFIGCFIFPNRPIDPMLKENQELHRWMVPFYILEEMTNIKFKPLFEKYYNYKENITEFENINELTPVEFKLTPIFKKQMLKSLWYSIIIYSTNLKQLEKNWKYCQDILVDENLNYHKDFYDLVKQRLNYNRGIYISNDDLNNIASVSVKASMAGEPNIDTETMVNSRTIPKHKHNINFFKLIDKNNNM